MRNAAHRAGAAVDETKEANVPLLKMRTVNPVEASVRVPVLFVVLLSADPSLVERARSGPTHPKHPNVQTVMMIMMMMLVMMIMR